MRGEFQKEGAGEVMVVVEEEEEKKSIFDGSDDENALPRVCTLCH